MCEYRALDIHLHKLILVHFSIGNSFFWVCSYFLIKPSYSISWEHYGLPIIRILCQEVMDLVNKPACSLSLKMKSLLQFSCLQDRQILNCHDKLHWNSRRDCQAVSVPLLVSITYSVFSSGVMSILWFGAMRRKGHQRKYYHCVFPPALSFSAALSLLCVLFISTCIYS